MVTLKDVAQRANVSIATVSLVLNGKPSISEATRTKVLSLVDELGYRPNMVARSVKTNRTKAISVLVPTITNPAYPNVVHGIESSARKEGYQVILCCYAGDHISPIDIDCLSDLYDRMIDGMIICGVPTMPSKRHDLRASATMAGFISRGTPFVFLSDPEQLDHFAKTFDIDLEKHAGLFHLLSVDRESAAFKAVTYLIKVGHKRIALVGDDTRDTYPHNIPFLRKLHGYKRALETNAMSFDASLVAGASSEFEGGEQCVEHLLQVGDAPTAIFCTGDSLALGVLRGARRLGVHVPAELAVIGFDNIPVASYLNPTLSTVAMPTERITQEAFRRLHKLMSGEAILPNRMQFDTELIIRESC
ncbi:MAG: LacI family DNA-binding transcriptional regulator [Spirochaetales bacterium]|nr:LacI family DNA-binding transcriptional regulator [Spirochaetales bacterium]